MQNRLTNVKLKHVVQVGKIIFAISLIILVCLFVVVVVLFGWQAVFGPRIRPLTDRKFAAQSAASLERGQYLVEAVAHCTHCHSELDWDTPGTPPQPGKELAGRVWTLQGMPWLVSPNLTPDSETGAANWTDDMFARAIREGIGHDGRALFPTMPYQSYRYMSDEDVASIITYIRTVKPVRNILPKIKIPFPTNRLILSSPKPLSNSVPMPDIATPLKRGEYLVRISACSGCHTIQRYAQPVREMEFAGGFVFQTPLGVVASPNITPDPSGISYYDETIFLRVIRTGHVGARKLNPQMPWGYFRKMSDQDLTAIYAYLRTLKPIKHHVDNTEPPTYCKLCRQVHGFGNQN
jgi:mono/diheme cytochrome c family protein